MTIRSTLGALFLLAGGWLAVLTLVTAVTDAAPAALVVFPGDAFMRDLDTDVAIVSRSAISVTLASARPGLAVDLYHKGAWLVLPAGLRGCS